MKKRNKLVAAIVGLAAVMIVAGAGTVVYSRTASENSSEMVYKETTVEKGNLVVGVTESGSVSIGTVSQECDLDTSTSTSTTTSSSGSSSSGGASAMGTSSASGSGGAGASPSSSQSSSSGSSSSSASSATSSSSSVSLEVEEVYVTTGQKVSEGDKLLKITDDSIADYREQLESAVTTATLNLKEAKLEAQTQKLTADYTYDSNIAAGSVAQSQYDSTIASLQAAIDSAQEEIDESQSKIAEYETKQAEGEDVAAKLAEEQSNLTSLQAKLTTAQNDYTTKSIEAKQTYEEALLNYNNASSIHSIDTNGINDDVETAEDTLTEAQEALDDFNEQVGDGIIYSQYSGTLMTLGYAAGDTLSSSTDVATFADDTAVTMDVSVSQEDISAVNIGDEVQIALTAYEDEQFTGEVTSMDTTTSSDSSTVSYTVTVVFTGDVSRVYADMTGDVTFVTSEVEDVVYVSNKAIINEGTKSYVDVENSDGTRERREVKTGFSNGVNVEVTDGLEEGETALIESQVSGS